MVILDEVVRGGRCGEGVILAYVGIKKDVAIRQSVTFVHIVKRDVPTGHADNVRSLG